MSGRAGVRWHAYRVRAARVATEWGASLSAWTTIVPRSRRTRAHCAVQRRWQRTEAPAGSFESETLLT